jgi:hypothetical protein
LVSLSLYRSEDTVPKWDETRVIKAGLEDLGREGEEEEMRESRLGLALRLGIPR